MKLPNIRLIIIILFMIQALLVVSCKDIVDCETKIDKNLINDNNNGIVGLGMPGLVDCGNIKVGTTGYYSISLKNINAKVFYIKTVDNVNKSGWFTYLYPMGLPFPIEPGENILYKNKITVRFHADSTGSGCYYDTLTLNKSKVFKIPIVIRIVY